MTVLVYKNQRIFRKNTNENPIFLGPVLLHKDTSYKTYKVFLQHIATEVDSDINTIEMRISENMEFGTDDEKALTKAIEEVFPSADRYLCTKHLKDNIKHYLQNKIGVEIKQRNILMNDLFGSGGLIDADSTLDFETKASEFEEKIDKENDSLKTYFCNNLKPRLLEFVFKPRRKTNGFKNWTNNNAESMNNILKLSLDWKPKRTRELVEKMYDITNLHFMDYRSALHDTGNYDLTSN